MKTVTVISCAREPTYLIETLKSFNDPNTEVELVFQGRESAEMVEFLRHEKNVHDENPIAALYFDYNCQIVRVHRTQKISESTQLNGQYNYAQTLLHSKDGLILEDDVKVSNNLMKHVSQIEKLIPDENSIVSLYSCELLPSSDNLELTETDINRFRNTQAMFYPVSLASKFGQHLLDHLGQEPYDHALRTFCNKHRVKLFASNYSLVQHIGRITTGLGFHHQAKNFVDDYLK